MRKRVNATQDSGCLAGLGHTGGTFWRVLGHTIWQECEGILVFKGHDVGGIPGRRFSPSLGDAGAGHTVRVEQWGARRGGEQGTCSTESHPRHPCAEGRRCPVK